MKEHSEPSKEETKTDNELIGEFMGYGSIAGEYDTSWDWLMPVVEKIENIEGMYVRIQKDRCIMFDSGFGESDILIRDQRQPNQYPAASVNQPSKIEAVYKAIVQFIKFYNTQQHERK